MFHVRRAALMCAVAAATAVGAHALRPELESVVPARDAYAGRPAVIEYRITWAGAPDQVRVAPPILPAVEGCTITVARTRTERAAGENRIVHEVEVTAAEPGSYAIPPIEIGYHSPESTELPGESSENGLPAKPEAYAMLRSEAVTLEVQPERSYGLWAGIAGAVIAAGGFVWAVAWFARRWRRPEDGVQQAAFDLDAVNNALHRARQHRLDGDFYAFFRDLCETVRALPRRSEHETLEARLHSRAQEVGYKNERPPDDELDGAMRDVERAVHAARNELHDAQSAVEQPN